MKTREKSFLLTCSGLPDNFSVSPETGRDTLRDYIKKQRVERSAKESLQRSKPARVTTVSQQSVRLYTDGKFTTNENPGKDMDFFHLLKRE